MEYGKEGRQWNKNRGRRRWWSAVSSVEEVGKSDCGERLQGWETEMVVRGVIASFANKPSFALRSLFASIEKRMLSRCRNVLSVVAPQIYAMQQDVAYYQQLFPKNQSPCSRAIVHCAHFSIALMR
jgi:hypothetical protein